MEAFGGATLESLRRALPELAAETRERAEEFERARELALDFADRLKAAGAYRVLLTSEQGGLGGTPLDWFDMTVTLATADASTGWTCGHGAVANAFTANIATSEFSKRVFADSNASVAWSNLGQVEPEPVDGGFRISGSWGFETGCSASTWVGGFVALPPEGEGGTPRIRVALAPTSQVRVEKSWDPIGLAGTGSHTVVFDDIFVPDEQILDWPLGKPTAGYPTGIYVPGVWVIGTCAAATHIGVARHAIDEARQQLAGKTDRATGQPLMARPNLLMTLEEAEGTVLAYRAGIEAGLLRAWEVGLEGKSLDAELRVQLRVAAVTATMECARAVRSVYEACGAWAVHRSGIMQRLYRDAAACLIHHISVSRNGLETAGRVRAGLDELTWRV